MTTLNSRLETTYERSIRRAREQFLGNVDEHEMTVLLDTLDDGTPYRHVRFARPGTGIWSFNLVTWPGHLAISGDLQTHVFCRLHDMFDFFRGGGSVNPSYWGEKLRAEGHRSEHGESPFNDEVFREVVQDHLDDYKDQLSAEDFAALNAYAAEELLEADYYGDRNFAVNALSEFEWVSPDESITVRFSDAWEYDLGGYDHHFLLAIHAIQWGVNKYLAEHPGRLIREGSS